MNALDVVNLRAGYGPTDVVHDVNFQVPEGHIVALLGRNGVGKSTLLKTIMGIVPARVGRVAICNDDVTGWASHRIARQRVAYVPQDAALFAELTVQDNLELALDRAKNVRVAGARVFDLFPILGERLSQKAGTLSGGEQKMLNLGRALMKDPRLLLIDEVTEGVQPSIVNQIGVAIEQQCARGTSILLVEQKVAFALGLASRFVVMQRGEVVEDGLVTTNTPSAIEKYLVL